MEQPEQATAKPHKHAALIAEWIKDTSRVVELYDTALKCWRPRSNPAWVPNCQYRFADTVKPEVTSPLTDTELANLWCLESGSCGVALRNIANAAHKAALKEVAAMPSKTSLNCSGGGFSAARMQEFGDACIAEFQAQLLKQLGE